MSPMNGGKTITSRADRYQNRMSNKVMQDINTSRLDRINHKSTEDIICQIQIISKPTDLGKFEQDIKDKLQQSKENKCVDCEFSCDHELILRQHILVEHLRLEPERYQCLICNKIITDIIEHRRLHLAPVVCELCKEPLENQLQYLEHVKFHPSDILWPCNICYNAYSRTKMREHKDNMCRDKKKSVNLKADKSHKSSLILVDSLCGLDTAKCSVRNDMDFKLINVYFNSKLCDTDDLESFSTDISEPSNKKRKLGDH